MSLVGRIQSLQNARQCLQNL